MIQRTLASKDHDANQENWKGKRELKNRFNFGLDEHELPVIHLRGKTILKS